MYGPSSINVCCILYIYLRGKKTSHIKQLLSSSIYLEVCNFVNMYGFKV